VNAEALAFTVASLIRANGKTATLRRPTVDEWDETTRMLTPGEPVDYQIDVVEGSLRLGEIASLQRIQGLAVTVSDKRLMVAAEGIPEPLLSDSIIVGGREMAIAHVRTVTAVDTPLYYEVQCRG
jgi:hypothetical protein